MGSFSLYGTPNEYLRPDPGQDPGDRSLLGVRALPEGHGHRSPRGRHCGRLRRGRAVEPVIILVSWQDDEWHAHWAWIPAGNVRRVNDSERDIEEYRRCPDKLRSLCWENKLPSFLPA